MTRRRLDKELVRRGLAETRTEASRMIGDGLVVVGDNPQPKAATQVSEAVSIRVSKPLHPYVGRGGVKLEAALDHFELDPAGWNAIDLGASTGGFTDCLLQRGARHVTAVDVGYGQLDWSLRDDPRVTVRDRTNVRTTPSEDLGGPFDAVVADLSFISLCSVARQLRALGTPTADWVLLIKPQFEVGRDGLARGGIVRDPMLRHDAITRVLRCLASAGLGAVGLMGSPITGAKQGNREYLGHFRSGASTVTVDVLEDES